MWVLNRTRRVHGASRASEHHQHSSTHSKLPKRNVTVGQCEAKVIMLIIFYKIVWLKKENKNQTQQFSIVQDPNFRLTLSWSLDRWHPSLCPGLHSMLQMNFSGWPALLSQLLSCWLHFRLTFHNLTTIKEIKELSAQTIRINIVLILVQEKMRWQEMKVKRMKQIY